MTTDTAASTPAGGENTAAPAGDMPSILSIDDAAQRWMETEDTGASAELVPQVAPEAQTATANPAEAAMQGDEVQPGAQTPPEDVEFIDWDRISPDKKMRLRDGFEFDKKFVNENIDRLRKLPEVEREIAARVQQLQNAQAQHAHKEQFFAQVLPLAIASAQAAIPAEPEPPAFDPTDPVDFMGKQAQYQASVAHRNKKIGEFQQLQRAQATHAHEQQQLQAHHTRQYLDDQRTALFTAIPRLRDKGERDKFAADYARLAEGLGFDAQEYNQAIDHRVMLMADLAMDGLKYRKLKTEPPRPKPVTQPQAQTPPVAEPGRRQTTTEAAASKRQELLDRARRTGGSVNDIARLVAELD